jgi:hypothetical protein
VSQAKCAAQESKPWQRSDNRSIDLSPPAGFLNLGQPVRGSDVARTRIPVDNRKPTDL